MTSASTRFDPKPDVPYGTCMDCPETMANREELRAHFDATSALSGGSSHRVSMTNLGRVERIEQELESLVQDALSSFVSDVDDLIARGQATEEEITEAMRSIATSDFSDEWESGR